MESKYTLVLLSGGVGKRMHMVTPKQYMLLAGKPVIMHILERIDQLSELVEVIVVCADEYVSSIRLMLSQYGVEKQVRFAKAGATRQESVNSGLSLVETEYVIIHEAARPFVKVEDFRRLISEPCSNALFGLAIPFTVVRGHEYVEGELTRSELVNVQLPQKFELKKLKEAHRLANEEGKVFTEDASLLFHYFPNEETRICPGAEYNIKLTTRMDMLYGEIIYNEEFRNRR